MPLAAFTRYAPSDAPLAVNHQGLFPAATISFNLPEGVALGDAVAAVEAAQSEMGMPVGIHGSFSGTAQAIEASLVNEPVLIVTAQIGLAKTAFYPTLLLTATGGLQSSSISDWFTWPSRFWSVGPSLAQTLFDFGRRRAQVHLTEAA